MASHSEPRLKSYIAGADLSAKQYHAVKLDADGDTVTLAGANGKACGILMNAPGNGERAEVALPGGGAKLKLDEAVVVGNYLTSSTASQGEVADAAGEHVCAYAMEGGSDGDIIAVEVVCFDAQASDA